MNVNELFIDACSLPKPLTKLEVYELLDKIKQGDECAVSKLAVHNIRLVLSEVTGRFKNVQYDKKELVSIGNVGLMKAITTFDTSKKVEFSTYAIRCIDNEILMFLRKLKKYANDDSLDRTINCDNDGNELKIVDIISDDFDMVSEYADNEIYIMIREIIKELSERDRKIVMLYFGFYNDETHIQTEIAEMLGISRSYVSRLISKIIKQIGKQLEERGLIELNIKKTVNDKILRDGKGMRRLQTIYEYFDSYTKEQVDEMLKKLSDDDRELIILRYGDNLNNPVSGKLNKEQTKKFYGSLIPKMKRLLANPNKKRRIKKKIIEIENIGNSVLEQSQNEMSLNPNLDMNSLNSNALSMTKEDYLKTFELLRTQNFIKMINIYSPKELMIATLKLGYIDGKCFSTSAISEFLCIEQQEVIDTTKKVLITYKELMNQIIDDAIKKVSEESEKTMTLSLNKNLD